ncbi:MAG: IS110 family transposase [Ferruginibacter sp.]
MKKQTLDLPVINHHAAGIDVGSKEHWVAIGQNDTDVKIFGVYTKDYQSMVEWLNENAVTSIVMEATGSYWQTLFSHLEKAGFEVLLCSSKTIKNPAGKTDKKDSRWLQKLHTLGLLKPSFIPEKQIEELRQYTRYRHNIMLDASAHANRIQKILHLLNVRLDVVFSDVMGASGMKIIKAILAGERCGEALAAMANNGIKKSKQEIALALVGNWKKELLFQLADVLSLYERLQESIIKTEIQIEELLKEINKENAALYNDSLTKKKKQKGQYKIDVAGLSYQYFGVDLMAIDGVAHNTVMTLISEVGMDIKKFKTAKTFASWLRLCPNNKTSGGKILSSRTPRSKNLLAHAFRNAANTIAQRKEGSLKVFFSRIAFKKGRGAAISATARKIAVIVWNMILKQTPYLPIEENNYKEKIKKNCTNNIRKTMQRLNISVDELVFSR